MYVYHKKVVDKICTSTSLEKVKLDYDANLAETIDFFDRIETIAQSKM